MTEDNFTKWFTYLSGYEQLHHINYLESKRTEVVKTIGNECIRRIEGDLPTHLEDSSYWAGYKDALGELLEWMYDMEKKDVTIVL